MFLTINDKKNCLRCILRTRERDQMNTQTYTDKQLISEVFTTTMLKIARKLLNKQIYIDIWIDTDPSQWSLQEISETYIQHNCLLNFMRWKNETYGCADNESGYQDEEGSNMKCLVIFASQTISSGWIHCFVGKHRIELYSLALSVCFISELHIRHEYDGRHAILTVIDSIDEINKNVLYVERKPMK